MIATRPSGTDSAALFQCSLACELTAYYGKILKLHEYKYYSLFFKTVSHFEILPCLRASNSCLKILSICTTGCVKKLNRKCTLIHRPVGLD
jgi:hypothetical protein